MAYHNEIPEKTRVLAAVVQRAGRLLRARRPSGKRHAGRWEFPGGKFLLGETPLDAARRELAEELGGGGGGGGGRRAGRPRPGAAARRSGAGGACGGGVDACGDPLPAGPARGSPFSGNFDRGGGPGGPAALE